MGVLARYCYALAALVVLVLWLQHTGPGEQWTGAALAGMALAVGLLIAIGSGLAWVGARWRQHRRDGAAAALGEAIYRDLTASPPSAPARRYALYLRPFSTTGRLTVRNPKRGWLPLMPSYYEHARNIELETLFASALEPVLPLVGFGRRGEHFGIGRIEIADAHWWALFLKLAEQADWILMLPSCEGETRRELEHVMSGPLRAKTLLIMPPRLRGSPWRVEEHWDTLQARARELDLRLPDYTPTGCLFSLGAHARLSRVESIGRLTEERLREAFLRITRPGLAPRLKDSPTVPA